MNLRKEYVPYNRNCQRSVMWGLGGEIRPANRFRRFVGLEFVLVLSAAVLVIVITIDLYIILRARIGDTIEFHCHASQHCDDPMQRAT